MLFDLANSFNNIPVQMSKLSGTNLLWRNKSNSNEMSNEDFLDNYSWIIKDSFLTKNSNIRSNFTKTMFAERYGGIGIGVNGGGARVVNFDNAQLKGVGANALAGNGGLRSHSYGGLDIQGAVKEIIYSQLLNKISPVGVQPIRGLIFVDEKSAFHNGSSAPSVIMVRAPITRPGHFLPCINFRVKPENKEILRSDYSRILGIYKGIEKKGLLSDFYTVIQCFLDKSADQLSFFRMARLSHNALSPSNIGIDGRVLDTALCSFVVAGSNYGQATSFLEEASLPASIANEWFLLIKKFLKEEPVESHFLKLYEEKFYQYCHVNMGFIFALDREISTKLSVTIEWRKVASRILSLLSIGPPAKNSTLPTVDSVDFFNDVLTASLFAIYNNVAVKKSHKFLSEFIGDMRSLVKIMQSSLGWHVKDEASFCKALTIQTIKRAILSSYFFITYIGRNVDESYFNGNFKDTEKLITENDDVANWIYEDLLGNNCTIYSGNNISITYRCTTDDYTFIDESGVVSITDSVPSLSNLIDSLEDKLTIQNYDFHPYLTRLLALLNNDAGNSFNGVKNVFC